MKYLLVILAVITVHVASAQAIFIAKGKIEFEKQQNLHKDIDEAWDEGEDNLWKQNMKKNTPKMQVTYYDLYFNDAKTLYKAGKEAPITGFQKIPDWLKDRNLDNVIYNDVQGQSTVSLKNVFETNFLIQDTLTKIDWRITSDTRTIAGIECRKAIGKIMDSVYVIAFYTDLILTPGGPESFTGLPGMILGIAIPRINTTWFATKIELINVTEADLAPPAKGKKTNYKDLLQQLKKSTKDWGKESERNIWRIMI